MGARRVVGSDELNGHKCVCGFVKLAKRSLGKVRETLSRSDLILQSCPSSLMKHALVGYRYTFLKGIPSKVTS